MELVQIDSMSTNSLVARLTILAKKITELSTVEEAKHFHGQAAGVEKYLQEQRASSMAALTATELRVRAERRLGELLAGMPGKGSHGGDRKSSDIVSLEDLSIHKKQSERWQSIATVPEEDFEAYLQRGHKQGEITSAGLLKMAKQLRAQTTVDDGTLLPHDDPDAVGVVTSDLASLVSSPERFGCVYADPPWQYDNKGTRAAAADHYGTMTVEEIAALPVRELVAETAHLHLWTTNAFLEQSFPLMRAWGFEFRSAFVWTKDKMGIGNYWRNAHEYLLLGVRGPKASFRKHDLISWQCIARGEHSAKPYAVRKMVERASPGPYLELFGRQVVPGWTVFGNQVSRGLFDKEDTR